MNLSEYIEFDGIGLAALIRNREVSRPEVIDCVRRAIRLVDPEINAIIEEFAEPLAAYASEHATFAGVPFLIKDLALHAAGVLNESGSRLSAGMRFDNDTHLMQRFRRAGLRTLGRTATPEFGYSSTTEPLTNGPTRNPWDTRRMPGGSSGASAAAVASGIVPLAHANDGGGSIRIPAACCGLVGLKPTRGRVSPGPDLGEALNGLAVEFAVTRSVRDAAALLDEVQGYCIGDPYIIAPPETPYRDAMDRTPGPLRIAYTQTPWSDTDVDADLNLAVEKTATLCAAFGHDLFEAKPPIDWEEFLRATVVLWTANIAAWIDNVARAVGREPGESNLESTTLACYRYGKELEIGMLFDAMDTANALSRSVGLFFEEYDLLLTPTTASPALPIGTINANDPTLDAMEWSARVFGFCPFTPLFNMTGQPAISLPLFRSTDGLPLGVQFAGRLGDEVHLLQLARQLEQEVPWPRVAPLVKQLVA